MEAFKCFGLYKFALGMGNNRVLMPLAFDRCGEVDWRKKGVQNGFVSYDFQGGEVFGLGAETVQASKGIRINDDAPTFVNLSAITVYFRPAYRRGRLR